MSSIILYLSKIPALRPVPLEYEGVLNTESRLSPRCKYQTNLRYMARLSPRLISSMAEWFNFEIHASTAITCSYYMIQIDGFCMYETKVSPMGLHIKYLRPLHGSDYYTYRLRDTYISTAIHICE
jgi:hypothetical protein